MSLSKGQREELLRRVQDDVEVQRTIREARHGTFGEKEKKGKEGKGSKEV